jgi:hypothetical protein
MNLLANPNFSTLDGRGKLVASLSSWQVDDPLTWYAGLKSGISSAQCDQDMPRDVVTGWPLHTDGRLWQDVTVPEPHSQLSLTLSEQQHHGSNTAVVTIYGLVDGNWQIIWQRTGLADVPVNTVETRTIWHTNTYLITPEVICAEYRLEFFGRIDEGIPPQDACGWKITDVVFEAS